MPSPLPERHRQPSVIGGQLSIWPRPAAADRHERGSPPAGAALSAPTPRAQPPAIWDGDRQAFTVGLLRQVMLTRGFTPESLHVAAGIGHGTMYNALAGRPVRLATAGRILEVLAST